jgi:hypothetical protein
MTSYFLIYFVTNFVTYLNHMMQEETFLREPLPRQAGTVGSGTVAKHDVLL